MHLTPEILEATYDWLRATPPFRRWRLPKAGDVEFRVLAARKLFGQCRAPEASKPWRIDISTRTVAHTITLVRTMSHEMCHMRADMQGEKSAHGPLWRKAADLVCKEHGHDPLEF